MKVNDTISVNPSKTTLGHVELPSTSIFRSQVLGAEAHHNIDVLQLAFPSVKGGMGEFTKYALPLRTVFATILIVTGITLLSTTFSSAIGICSICFGGLLAMGFLTRPTMIGAAAYYCICGALAIRNGVPDVSIFSMMFGCILFGIVGSGKYSLDTLLRQTIIRRKKRAELRRQQESLSYKAFHSVMMERRK